MAIYRIFPSQDATIYSQYPTTNTGIDEILEVSVNSDYGVYNVSRALIQFSDNDLVLFNGITTNAETHNVYLKMFVANACNIPLNYNIDVFPISQSWDMGTGRYSNNPPTTNGVSWVSASVNIPWVSTGSDYISLDVNISQSFGYNDVKDIEIDVTEIYDNIWDFNVGEGLFIDNGQEISEGTIDNNFGLLVKLDDTLEFQNVPDVSLKFFSVDTHTIYPPCLELRWWDYSASSSLNEPTTQDIVVSLGNNSGEYQQDAIQRFRINCRDQYPIRTFTTSSVYLTNEILPATSSYWSLKDLDTEEIIFDYDYVYTIISCDNNGSYFDMYMSGLQPERYYQILIKTTISGSTLVFDNLAPFKVTR
jgi:hypothetical protein